MYRLTPGDYSLVDPLFAEMDNHLPVRAALLGSIAADVYADDLARPRVALISVRGRRLYLAGQHGPDTAQAIGRLFKDTLYPAIEREGVPVFSLCAAPAGWDAHMDAALAGKPFRHFQRQYYEYTPDLPLSALPLPEGYALRAADARLLAEGGRAHLDALSEEMMSERASLEDFLAHSFGVCPVTEDALAGWCLSEYNTEHRCEVGIATLPPHQGKGLATATAAAFVAEAAARGITRIGWHCYADNRPSWATALKVGFRKVEEYPACIVWCNEDER